MLAGGSGGATGGTGGGGLWSYVKKITFHTRVTKWKEDQVGKKG